MDSVILAIEGILAKSKNVVICGYGSEGQKFANELEILGIMVNAIYDDRAEARRLAIERFPSVFVGSIENINKELIEYNRIIVVCSHSPISIIKRIGMQYIDQIIPLYAIQCHFPEKFKPFIFYEGLHASDHNYDYLIEYILKLLSDDESRDLLKSVLQYRRDFRMSELIKTVCTFNEVLESNLFKNKKIRCYIDGGSYDGDTIDDVIRIIGNEYEIHAFEPSRKMAMFLRNKYPSNKVVVHEAAISKKEGTLEFEDTSSRTSMLLESSGNYVQCVDLDCVMAQRTKPVDFIKLNIEGSELDALRGAKKLIREDRPILAIHAYHRPSHIWEVPLMILSIVPNYQIFFRQQDSSLMESVYYAIPN